MGPELIVLSGFPSATARAAASRSRQLDSLDVTDGHGNWIQWITP
jgi:hypothetical protein